jgi:hypothetical protein
MAGDASSDAAGNPPAPCTSWTAFGTPQSVLIDAQANGWVGAISENSAKLFTHPYDAATRNDIWETRDLEGTPLSMIRSELNTDAADTTGWLSGDGLTLYLSSDRAGAMGDLDIWVSTRTPGTPEWNPPTLWQHNSTGSWDSSATLTNDQRIMLFISSRGGDFDIYQSTRADASLPWEPPVRVDELSQVGANERGVSVSRYGLEIIFASNRAGGKGGFDLYWSSRPNRSAPFDPPVNLAELNSAEDDVYAQYAQREATVYYNYNTRLSGGLPVGVYKATRTCLAP